MKNLELDLNRFKHYSKVNQGYTWKEQAQKFFSEVLEMEMALKFCEDEPSEDFKQETLDAQRALSGLMEKEEISEEDFEKHEEKIKNYLDSGKYPRKRGSICHTE